MRRPPWPTAAEYREAIADPSSFGRADLREGRLELGSGGLPKTCAGTFSTTFRVATASGDVAVRCFKSGFDDPQRRYAAIAELLRYVRNDALCRTDYDAEAIRVKGTPWPAVIMEWISGRSLDAEIARQVSEDIGGDAILRLATQFREVVRSLGALGIAHGDLQHGNILVADGKMRLIDYDAMYLPAIADLAQAEFGHRNYQHPQRRNAPFDSRLDRFSSLVIYVALVALASDRSLWTRFSDGDNLLFRAHDFTSSGKSELFRALLANNATSGLADVLRAACAIPVTETPSLEEAIAASASTMSAHPFDAPPKPPERANRPIEIIAPSAVVDVAASEVASTVRTAPVEVPRHHTFVDRDAQPIVGSARAGTARSLVLVTLAMALVGLAIGIALAALHRGTAPQVASRNATAVRDEPTPQATHALAHVRTPVPTKHVAAAPVVLVTTPATTAPGPPTATARPTTPPTSAPTIVPTPKPSLPPANTVKPTSRVATRQLQGSWQISEANDRVGTIVWTGAAAAAGDRTIVLDARKASVAGRSATPCERQTILHAEFAIGVGRQTVPYRETNCAGATSGGEIRVNDFAIDAGSFTGSVWQDGAKLGDFTASKR